MANPVIFVHGIEASWLKNHYPVDYQNEIYWDAVFNKQYDKLRLSPWNVDMDQDLSSMIYPHQTIGLVYGGMMNELRQDVTPASYVFTYDWRKDNRISAAQLAAFIELVLHKTNRDGIPSPGKVSLVGHSMGGLVIKWCVLNVLKDEAGSKVDRIVTICTPYKGSIKAIEALLPGARNFFGQEHDKSMRLAARTFPGLYQLLPSYEGAVVSEKGRPLDIFDPDSWQRSLLSAFDDRGAYPAGFFKARLDDARKFAQEIDRAYPPELDGRFGHIYGIGSTTWRTIKVDTTKGNEFDFADVESDNQGDGTVHRKAAEIAGKSPILIDKNEIGDLVVGQHANATTHHPVQDALVDALRDEGGAHRHFVSPR